MVGKNKQFAHVFFWFIFFEKRLSTATFLLTIKFLSSHVIRWYNFKLGEYRVEYKDGTEDYMTLDNINNIVVIGE